MNKRIKRKLYKSIKSKLNSDEPLTDFEKSHFVKYYCMPLRKRVTNIVNHYKEAAALTVDELPNDEGDRLDDSVEPEEIPINADRITVGTLNAENFNPINVVHVNTAPLNKEESKWQKAKSKVKGWFGK